MLRARPEIIWNHFSKSPAYAPLATTPLVFGNADSIEFQLVLRTLSVEDRTRFPDLVIDDYRVDEQRYYADHRVPNVRFEVDEVVAGRTARPASFLAWTQGGGASVEFLDAHVSFRLGRFRTTYKLIDRLWYVGALWFAQHARGTYQVRAFYREFVTPTMLVVVK